jgi:predicted DNA-binding transcriptional regulator AlpA
METRIEHEALTVSVEHFSTAISVSPDTGYRLVKLGLLQKIAGLGRNVRVSRQAAGRWIDASIANRPHLRPNNPYPKILNDGIEVLSVDCETAAQILGVSPSKMSDLVRDGALPKLANLQRLVRIPVCSIYGFMEHAEKQTVLTA